MYLGAYTGCQLMTIETAYEAFPVILSGLIGSAGREGHSDAGHKLCSRASRAERTSVFLEGRYIRTVGLYRFASAYGCVGLRGSPSLHNRRRGDLTLEEYHVPEGGGKNFDGLRYDGAAYGGAVISERKLASSAPGRRLGRHGHETAPDAKIIISFRVL